MGASQSSTRSPKDSASLHSNSSQTSPSSTSLQKALSRRRSSNKTVESSSSHGSSHHSSNTFNSSSHNHLPSHPEEDEDCRWYHGRRYHNTSSLYMLPNDTDEVDRIHLQHYIMKMAINKNLHVPIPENGRVIEFGCGPATWTMDMATEMATINFVGVDISAIYPTAIHPRNCNFYQENFLEGVSQPDSVFDVVYQRHVTCGLTFQNWQTVMKEAFRVLKPGGWYECVESDITIENAGPQTNLVFEHLRMSMSTRLVDPSVVRSLDKLMTVAGFTEVQVKEYTLPVGDWGGKVGQLWKQNVFSLLQTARPHLAKAAGIPEAQVADIVSSMNRETQEYKAHQVMYVVYGRKPL